MYGYCITKIAAQELLLLRPTLLHSTVGDRSCCFENAFAVGKGINQEGHFMDVSCIEYCKSRSGEKWIQLKSGTSFMSQNSSLDNNNSQRRSSSCISQHELLNPTRSSVIAVLLILIGTEKIRRGVNCQSQILHVVQIWKGSDIIMMMKKMIHPLIGGGFDVEGRIVIQVDRKAATTVERVVVQSAGENSAIEMVTTTIDLGSIAEAEVEVEEGIARAIRIAKETDIHAGHVAEVIAATHPAAAMRRFDDEHKFSCEEKEEEFHIVKFVVTWMFSGSVRACVH
ncbi:conserved hypothetical protein [Trichinella spiralis]|uniref:hypothetical protein n=1 Tax=Trichinella spiralis TaxID=6334 RepID=UPI0001EFC50B|nr:conserved hypothetical protein [Trichinella spiralis]